MNTILLSGAGGSNNWMPLLFPLLVILGIIYGTELFVKRLKKNRVQRENDLINELNTPGMPFLQEEGEGMNE